MTRVFILLLTLSTLPYGVLGQKLFKKTFDSSSAKEVQIDARFAYQVKLQTHNSDQIIVNARAEGEYGNDIIINLWQDASTVFIGSNFHPDYKARNDKLSAHKVLSVELDVLLPSNFDISLSGGSVSVQAQGEYEILNIVLDSGSCDLKQVKGTVFVTTISGDINLSGANGVVYADSEYGRVESLELKGPSEYNLKSSKGDIRVVRAQ